MNTREAARLARLLMNENGLDRWSFYFDSAKRRFGCCNYHKQEITLSQALVEINDEARVKKTILHEVAHAKAGLDAGHGQEWVAWCHRLGIPADRCYSAANTTTLEPTFVGRCPSCSHETKGFKRTRSACKRCCNRFNGGKFDARFRFVWSRTGGGVREPKNEIRTTIPKTDTKRHLGGLDRFR